MIYTKFGGKNTLLKTDLQSGCYFWTRVARYAKFGVQLCKTKEGVFFSDKNFMARAVKS